MREFFRQGAKEIGWMLAGMAAAAIMAAVMVMVFQGKIPFTGEDEWLECLCQDQHGRQVELQVKFPSNPLNPVMLRLPNGEERELQMVRAPKGFRYSDGRYTFWDRFNKASVTKNGRPLYDNCTVLE